MPIYVSASSRLHALFTALMNEQHSQPLRFAWAKVLGIPDSEVQFGEGGLAVVAGLVSAATEEAKRAHTEVGLPLREDHAAEWRRPVYAPGANLDAPLQQHPVTAEPLAYLGSVASVLLKSEGHSALPEGGELAALLAQVDDLAASVEASDELPDDVKRALLRRISQVRFAVENARVGGREAVEEAVELLLGATVVRGSAVPNAMGRKILAVIAAAFTAFSAGPAIQASLEAWPHVAQTLGIPSGGTHDDGGNADAPESPPNPAPDRGG